MKLFFGRQLLVVLDIVAAGALPALTPAWGDASTPNDTAAEAFSNDGTAEELLAHIDALARGPDAGAGGT